MNTPRTLIALATLTASLLVGGCQWYLPSPDPSMPRQQDCQIDTDFNIDCNPDPEPTLSQQ